jgi:hypothetical protein
MKIKGFDRLLDRKRKERLELLIQLRQLDEEIRILSEIQPHVTNIEAPLERRRGRAAARADRDWESEVNFDGVSGATAASANVAAADFSAHFRQDTLPARVLKLLARCGAMDIARLAAALGVTQMLTRATMEYLRDEALAGYVAATGEFQLTPRGQAIPELKGLLASSAA